MHNVTCRLHAPSHYGFSDLEMEDIGMLRLDLLAYVKEHGEDALKWLCRKMADTKTASTVLKLNVPIYGEPDAGKHFETKHSSVLTGPCGLRRCKTQPCFYVQ